MIGWIMTNWMTQLLCVVAAIWFLNGLRKVIFKPRFRLIGYSETKAGCFVELERQQLFPPWGTVKECWMRRTSKNGHIWFCREGDGADMSSRNDHLVDNAIIVMKARQRETEVLLEEDRKAAN